MSVEVEKEFARAIVDMVPQWYRAEVGLHAHSLKSLDPCFYTTRPLTGRFEDLYTFADGHLFTKLDNRGVKLPTPSELELFRQTIASRWLDDLDSDPAWGRILEYAERLRYRTYENIPVTVNLVVKDGSGTHDVTEAGSFQKIMDPLATSPHVCVEVDFDLKFLGYREADPHQGSRDAFNFCPSFVKAAAPSLDPREYLFSRTSDGDLVIADRNGIVAAWRKGKWYLYERNALRNCFVDVFELKGEAVNLAEHLIDLSFDLSYKRHGALLVYDCDEMVLDEVDNQGSIITKWEDGTACPDAARSMLKPVISEIRPCGDLYDHRKSDLLKEAASMDGALIFDSENVFAFGAMIKENTGPSKELVGARTTAAHSARRWGAKSIKISSDGDITVFFESECSDTSDEPRFAEIEYA